MLRVKAFSCDRQLGMRSSEGSPFGLTQNCDFGMCNYWENKSVIELIRVVGSAYCSV